MGFTDVNGSSLINDEQKIRVALSDRARIIMTEDMEVFGTTKEASFINTVLYNYKDEAKSSISLYLQQRLLELDRLFSTSELDTKSKEISIDQILNHEKTELLKKKEEILSAKSTSKLYHINDQNIDHLIYESEEDKYYGRPGLYIHAIMEEYCSLPFIERERIFRKDIYDIVDRACKETRILKIHSNIESKDRLFYVYPYKIVPDPFHTQSYLVCYSRTAEEKDSDKVVASFSMARINRPSMLTKTFHLNKQEIANIEFQLSNNSPAYLLGKPEQVKVKLTKHGKQIFQKKLFSRPLKIDELSTDDIYVFDCTLRQAYNYFFSFGPDAEILEPKQLRDEFKLNLSNAIKKYK